MAAQPSVEELLLLFFNRGNSSVGKGREFVQRSSLERRTAAPRSPARATRPSWTRSCPRECRTGLASIASPASSSRRSWRPPTTTHHDPDAQPRLLAEHLPDAKIEVHPDASHRLASSIGRLRREVDGHPLLSSAESSVGSHCSSRRRARTGRRRPSRLGVPATARPRSCRTCTDPTGPAGLQVERTRERSDRTPSSL
jgi:hypothetical protein